MTTARSATPEVGPKPAEPSAEVLFSDVRERRGLSERHRRLITV